MGVIIAAWLFGCFVLWFLLRRFTRLRGGLAVGLTIAAGSLPAWVLLFPTLGSLMDDDPGLIGVVLLLILAGGTLLALGLLVVLATLAVRLVRALWRGQR